MLEVTLEAKGSSTTQYSPLKWRTASSRAKPMARAILRAPPPAALIRSLHRAENLDPPDRKTARTVPPPELTEASSLLGRNLTPLATARRQTPRVSAPKSTEASALDRKAPLQATSGSLDRTSPPSRSSISPRPTRSLSPTLGTSPGSAFVLLNRYIVGPQLAPGEPVGAREGL